jgi:ATP-binding cassette, subfamily B, bacterial
MQPTPKESAGRMHQKQSSHWSRIRALFKLMWKASPWLLLALLFTTTLMGILPIITISLSALLLNAVAALLLTSQHTAAIPSTVVLLLLLMGGASLLVQIASQVQNTIRTLYQTKLANVIQRRIAEKASSLDLSFFEDPDLQNKMTNASTQASYRPMEIITQSTMMISSLITFVSVGVVLAFWHVWLLPLLLCPTILLFWVNIRYSRKKARMILDRTPLLRKGQYFYSLLTADIFAKEIRVFNLRAFFLRHHQKTLDGMYRQDRALASRQLGLTSLVQVLLTGIQTAFTLYVMLQLLSHALSFGQYSLYTQSASQLNTAFLSLMLALAQLYEAQLFLSYLFDFLALEATVEKGGGRQNRADGTPLGCPCLEFRDVTFRYPDTEQNTLDHLTFMLYPGQVMALVGKNGAGKTTFVKLLAGLYQPTQGQILLDGIDITTLDRDTLRASLGILFQDYPVYNLSAAQNIGVGKIEQIENFQRIEGAARRSGFHQVVENFPEKYGTILGRWIERGQELSGGQRQLAGLSRALMREAPVLILDEPTAALDPQNEWQFFQDILTEQRNKNQCIIFISHRFSSVRHADRILVLESGKKVEEGNHQELMEKKGIYAEMYTVQARMYREIRSDGEITVT